MLKGMGVSNTRCVPTVWLCLDVSARPFIDPDLLSFSMPYAMFKEMEANVEGSFIDKSEWNKVSERSVK
ncbi:MAG: DUF169 domain-containing protein [Syntrophomonadaceae bacterium]|nr:DUF169 domain-containing protein [Syntrophomonadaceae bacterium]